MLKYYGIPCSQTCCQWQAPEHLPRRLWDYSSARQRNSPQHLLSSCNPKAWASPGMALTKYPPTPSHKRCTLRPAWKARTGQVWISATIQYLSVWNLILVGYTLEQHVKVSSTTSSIGHLRPGALSLSSVSLVAQSQRLLRLLAVLEQRNHLVVILDQRQRFSNALHFLKRKKRWLQSLAQSVLGDPHGPQRKRRSGVGIGC